MNLLTKVSCNLCNIFFLSNDEFIDIRIKKHEEWHRKSTYFGSKHLRVVRKVEWRNEVVQ